MLRRAGLPVRMADNAFYLDNVSDENVIQAVRLCVEAGSAFSGSQSSRKVWKISPLSYRKAGELMSMTTTLQRTDETPASQTLPLPAVLLGFELLWSLWGLEPKKPEMRRRDI